MMKSTMTEKQMGDYHLFHLSLTERKGHLTFRTANTLFPQHEISMYNSGLFYLKYVYLSSPQPFPPESVILRMNVERLN